MLAPRSPDNVGCTQAVRSDVRNEAAATSKQEGKPSAVHCTQVLDWTWQLSRYLNLDCNPVLSDEVSCDLILASMAEIRLPGFAMPIM